MPGFFNSLLAAISAGERACVATIVQTRGSSPRAVGTRMLIRPGGSVDGTVGGGCGEADVLRAARDVLDDGRPRRVIVDLTEEIALHTDGVCGGIMEIYLDSWEPDSPQTTCTVRSLLEAQSQHLDAVLSTVVDSTSRTGSRVLTVDGRILAGDLDDPALAAIIAADATAMAAQGRPGLRQSVSAADAGATPSPVLVYHDVILPRPELIIVGAGHVAQPVADVGRLLDLRVTVIDDRPLFANARRFPTADRIIVDDFETALDSLPIGPRTYVVLVTRGHAHDVRSLRKIIHRPAAYIGMIGSRRRVFAVMKLLHDEGVPLDTLLRLHAPIGIDVETETPGEIALSIGAEILKVRRGGRAPSLSDRTREQYRASLLRGELAPLT